MNPTQLIEHFDRLSDTPDAIPRICRFIRDLAVRGRLVKQDPNEKPAYLELNHRDAPLSEKRSYEVPQSWAWARVGDVAECRLGKMLDKAKNKGAPHRYLRNVNVRWFDFDLSDVLEMPFEDLELDEFSLRRGDVLICEGGEPGRGAVWDQREADIYFQKAIHRVRFSSVVEPRFFVNVLRSSAESGHLATYFTGVGIKHLTGKGLASFLFQIPPLVEQQRIVAKVDELMALCGRLGAAQAERERRRDRLAATSLQRLNRPAAETSAFRDHACFHFRHLPRLTTRIEHIQQLRQAILNLAVRGRLVPQAPNDEPTAEAIARMNVARSEDEPFAVPKSWAWVSVDSVGKARLGKMLDKLKNKGSPRRYLRNVNVRWFEVDLSDVFQMRFEDSELDEFALRKGDVLICEGGEPGRAAVWDEREAALYFQKAIHRVRFSKIVEPHFFVKALRESADSGRLSAYFTGVGIKHLTGKGLASFVFPLPPLAEQHRIVAKIDELMALCDRLEAQLTASQTDSRRLLEAVLHEALAGTA